MAHSVSSPPHTALVWWLRIVALFVLATLVIGGATRLTDSGLSITEWEPILGIIPPLSEAAWQDALALYRQIPEYQLVNRGMSLGEFKVIYYWEWGHRLIARVIGLVFAVPLAVFWWRGMLPGWFKPWALLLFALGGLQGFVGWWMVTSGLVERVDVSQYRLAVHLTLACLILALTVWLSVALQGAAVRRAAPAALRVAGAVLVGACLCQIAMGAIVAGMDAGLASNTWPLMNGALVPEGLWTLQPALSNAFENPLTAQFIHRMMGYALLVIAAAFFAISLKAGIGVKRAALVLTMMVAQAVVGVGLVVWQVPIVLASLHQVIGAAILWVAVSAVARLAPRSVPQSVPTGAPLLNSAR